MTCNQNNKTMKKCILIALLLPLFAACGNKEAEKRDAAIVAAISANAEVYKLFPTQNLWTFIKLDTRSGKMWQVQYDVKENNRGEVVLNDTPLAEKGKAGRFTLCPTQNIWTFILLDTADGRTWQVQWSQDEANRGIAPISR